MFKRIFGILFVLSVFMWSIGAAARMQDQPSGESGRSDVPTEIQSPNVLERHHDFPAPPDMVYGESAERDSEQGFGDPIITVKENATAQASRGGGVSQVAMAPVKPNYKSVAQTMWPGILVETTSGRRLKATVRYSVWRDLVFFEDFSLSDAYVANNYIKIIICKWPTTGPDDNVIMEDKKPIVVGDPNEEQSFSITTGHLDAGKYFVYAGFESEADNAVTGFLGGLRYIRLAPAAKVKVIQTY